MSKDTIYRQDAIDAVKMGALSAATIYGRTDEGSAALYETVRAIKALPSVQPKRKWTSCSNPPKHHKDVIVRGIEAIGNVTVHKVMQWDVDTWRPTDYAPSVMWKEWSEI